MAIEPNDVLRLNMPQWQGGDHPAYRTGSRMLSALLPDPRGPVETVAVPVPTADQRPKTEGIVFREVLLAILHDARAAVARHDPAAIVTVGGDCLVDLAPIAHLNQRYAGDLAIVWVDAHPDILNAEVFGNAHAHVLAMLMGQGDAAFVAAVPVPVRPKDVLYVGLTETTPYETGFLARHDMVRLSPEDLAGSIRPVIDWLRASGKTHVAIHFDLDVLDPARYDFLLFSNPDDPADAFEGVAKGRMTLEQVSTILTAIGEEAEVVGLALTEYLPWGR